MKDERICIRVAKNDKEIILKKAKQSRRNLTDFMIDCALKKQIYVIDGLPQLVLQISKIGNNINQVVRLAHTNGYVSNGDVIILKNYLNNIQNTLYDFVKELK